MLALDAKSGKYLWHQKIFPGGKGALKDYNLDDVFSDLTRDAQGRATAILKGRKQQLEISQGPNYKALVI